MSKITLRFLGILSGILIIVSGLAYKNWAIPFDMILTPDRAKHLLDNSISAIVYTITMNLSYILFLPVVITLTVRLFRSHPNISIIGFSLFLFGMIFDAMGSIPYLSQWSFVIPECVNGNQTALQLFDTFFQPMLVFALIGTTLLFLATLVWSIGMMKVNVFTSFLLLLTFLSMIIAGICAPLSPSKAFIAVTSSFFLYGFSQMRLGFLTAELKIHQSTEVL